MGTVFEQATEQQLDRRVFKIDLDTVEYQSRRARFRDSEIYFMDHEGRFWDEVGGGRLNSKDFIEARPDEIQQLYSDDLYDKAPLAECWH